MNKQVFHIGSRGIGNEIVLNDPHISPKHARIVVQKDGLQYIEEQSRSAPVLVNGVRVKRKVIRQSDQISLGRSPFSIHRHFKVKDGVIRELRASNDFSEEFEELRFVYEEYIQAKEAIEKSAKKKELLFDPLLAVPVAGIFLRNIARSMTSGKSRTTRMEAIQNLRYEFFKLYKCPNPDCGKSLGEVPWKTLAAQASCDKCHVIWIKK